MIIPATTDTGGGTHTAALTRAHRTRTRHESTDQTN